MDVLPPNHYLFIYLFELIIKESGDEGSDGKARPRKQGEN